jgi:hypothetical protein
VRKAALVFVVSWASAPALRWYSQRSFGELFDAGPDVTHSGSADAALRRGTAGRQ